MLTSAFHMACAMRRRGFRAPAAPRASTRYAVHRCYRTRSAQARARGYKLVGIMPMIMNIFDGE